MVQPQAAATYVCISHAHSARGRTQRRGAQGCQLSEHHCPPGASTAFPLPALPPLPIFSQVLALIAVKATEHITKRARGIVAENTAEAAAFFGRWEHVFDWAPPDAGPIAFPRRAGSAGRAMRRRTAGVLTKARGCRCRLCARSTEAERI
jgi:hypothetical protein